MDDRRSLRSRVALAVAVVEWTWLVWRHFHGGMPSHHFLDRADMPAISNGWGGLLLPWMTWFLLGRVQRRVASQGGKSMHYALAGFVCALPAACRTRRIR
jgi:hypothetical protein